MASFGILKWAEYNRVWWILSRSPLDSSKVHSPRGLSHGGEGFQGLRVGHLS